MTILDKIALKTKPVLGGNVQKIVNGELADEGEYPYSAALISDDFGFFCGGSLITPSVVLTASHCVEPNAGTADRVLLGCTDIQGSGCEDIEVVETILHPDFDLNLNVLGGNDLAILVLAQPSTQETAQIPSPLVGQNAFVDFPSFEIGWGNTIPVTGEFQGGDNLREADSVVLDNDICEQQNDPLFNLAFGVTNTIDETMICSLTNSRGSCQGDSGGALLIACDGADADLVIGATSFGLGCAYDGHPNMFARTFNQAGFDFIVGEVTRIGEFDQLSVVDDFGSFCADSPVTVSPIAPTPFPTSFLEGWTCEGFFYGTQDGCDCECGIPDPDCQFDQVNFFCGGNNAFQCPPEDECRNTPNPTSSPTVPTASPTTDAPTRGPTNNDDGANDDDGIFGGIDFEVQVAVLGVIIIILFCAICCVCCFIAKSRSKEKNILEENITAKELQF